MFPFTVTVSGTPSDVGYGDSDGDGIGVKYSEHDEAAQATRFTAVKVPDKSPTLPKRSGPSIDEREGANTLQIQVDANTSPGVYEVSVPVTQTVTTYKPSFKQTTVTQSAKARSTVLSNAKVARSDTSVSVSSYQIG